MFATIRRYDGVDQNRSAELTRKVNEMLVPKLEKLSGFAGYDPIEAGNGVFTSLSLFETPEQSKESTKIVATWIRDEKLDTMIPNEPKITSGKVVVHSDRVLVAEKLDPHRIRPEGGPACRAPFFSPCRRQDYVRRVTAPGTVTRVCGRLSGAAVRSTRSPRMARRVSPHGGRAARLEGGT